MSGKSTLFDSPAFPVVVDRRDGALRRIQTADDLVRWIDHNRESIETCLQRRGAILFRGFPVNSLEDFQRVAGCVDQGIGRYIGGATDRAHARGSIYESTPAPKGLRLPLHSETSYMRRYPRRLFFYCRVPAASGGATTIADNRGILAALPERLVNELRRRQVRYIRNIRVHPRWLLFLSRLAGSSVIKTWQDTFETSDPAEVERFCRDHDIPMHWNDDGGLCMTDVLPAVIRHPVTSEEVWFSQLHVFHVNKRKLGPLVYWLSRAVSGTGERALFDCTYGDGGGIPLADVLPIYEVLERHERPVQWRANDVLMLDNVLCSHGRLPFRGRREVYVALAM